MKGRITQRRTLHPLFLAVRMLSISVSCAMTLGGCAEWEHRAALRAIVREGVTEDQLPARLKMEFRVYQRGEPAWDDLQTFLSREPLTDLGPLREAVKKYPRILYHTTEWQMKWLFVDDKGVVRDYFLSSQ